MRTQVALAAFTVVFLAMAGSLRAADQSVGTWKLNLAKSKYSTGVRPYKEWVCRIYEEGGNRMAACKGIDADGKPTSNLASTPIGGGRRGGELGPNGGYGIDKRIDDYSFVRTTYRKDGTIIGTTMYTVSKDKMTYTAHTKRVNAQGGPVDAVEVYDKQ